ncbi:MAG: TetR/AcrR family transcriptional regulator [Acidimicrobiales bacterium]
MPAVGGPRRRARRGQGDRLRDEIVTAATALLAERGGEEAVSIRAIADKVGVTPPSIYLHFADKDELFLAVCDDRFRELDRLSNLAAAGTDDPLERIRRRGQAYVQFGLDNPEHYRVLFMGPRHAAATTEQMKEWAAFEHLVDDVKAAIAAGLLSGDPFVSALGLWATVHGITSLMITMPTFPWPPLEQLLTACGGMPQPLPAPRSRVRRR